MRAAGTGWRRALAHRLVLAATFGTVLVATTLLAVTSLYGALVTESGLRRALTEAPLPERVLLAGADIESADSLAANDEQVRAAVDDAFAGIGADVFASATSTSYGIPPRRGAEVSDLVVFAWYDDLPGHTTLSAGSWPGETSGGPVQVAMPTEAAEQLGIGPGDSLRVTGQLNDDEVTARVSGTFDVDRPDEPYWLSDPLAVDGVERGSSFTTYGPLAVSRQAFLDRFEADATAGWRIAPDLTDVTSADLPGLRSEVGALGSADTAGTLSEGQGEDVLVESDLPVLLDRVDRPLLVLRSTVTVPAALLVVLAGYTLLQCTRLLADQRGSGEALMRARGMSRGQLAGLALREALVLTVPAALAAPWLAALLLRATDGLGALADDGVAGSLARPDLGTWLVAAVVGLGACLLLVLGAAGSSEDVASRVAQGRPARASELQRSGGDLVLLLAALLAGWQLTRYGSPVVGDASGRLDVDPLLVLAPTVLVTAGAVLVLRLLPVVTLLADRLVGRSRGAVSAIGVWRLSRRARELSGPAVLLALATAVGVFAVVFAGAWTQSRVDQAEFRTGADLRVDSVTELTRTDLDSLPGVDAVTPVLRDAATFGEVSAEVLAVDADAAADVLLLRDDLASIPTDDLIGALVDGRPARPALELPANAAQVVLPLRLDAQLVDDRRVPPAQVNLVLRDDTGLLHRLVADDLDLDGERRRLVFDLGPYAGGSLLALEVNVDSGDLGPQEDVDLALAAPRALAGSGADLGPLPASHDGRWRAVMLPQDGEPAPAVTIFPGPVGDGLRALLQPGCCEAVTYSFALVDPLAGPEDRVLPVLVTSDLAEAVGDAEAFVLELGAAAVELRVVGVLDAVPSVDSGVAGVVVDLDSLESTVYEQSLDLLDTGEWWASTAADPATVVEAASADDRFAEATVSSPDPAADPVGDGVSGALGIGALAAAAFAVLGFALASVVSARGRRGEVLVLEAVGVGRRQATRLLVIEQATLVVLGVGVGLLVGVLTARFVVPLVTLSSTAEVPVPDVLVEPSWLEVGVFVAGVAAATAAVVGAVVATQRRRSPRSAQRFGEEA